MNTNLKPVGCTERVSDEVRQNADPVVGEMRELSMEDVMTVAGGPVVQNNDV